MTASEATPSEPAGSPEEGGPPWQRLHPASLFVNLLPQTWRTIRGMWPLLLLLIFGGRGGEQSPGAQAVDVVLLLTFFALTVARTTAHFLTLRYRIHAGKLEVQSGLLNKRSRVLDPYRIQNLELVQNPLHKLTGLVELRIETAGDTSTEGLLSALDVAEASRLKSALEALSSQAAPDEAGEAPDEGQPLLKQSALELLAYGLTQRRVGTVTLLFAAGAELLGQLDPSRAEQIASALSVARLGALVLLAFAATWLFSAAQALLRHQGFQLRLQGERLVSVEGLLTRRRVEIPRGKVQLVQVDEPWLRRQMGYGTVLIQTAGLGGADGEVRQAEGIVPMVPREEMGALVRSTSPVMQVDPWQVPLRPAHPRALYRACVGGAIRAALLALALGLLLKPWGWLALALIPLSLPVSWLDWRRQGWLVTDDVAIARAGFFTRRTWIIDRRKIQSVHLGQSPLMRWNGLVGVHLWVAGSQVRLPDLGMDDGLAVLADLRRTWTPNRMPGATPTFEGDAG